MESLAYLHLVCAYQGATSTVPVEKNQKPEECALEHRTNHKRLEFLLSHRNQIKQKLVCIFKPKLLVSISVAVLAITLMLPSPALALLRFGSCNEDVAYVQRKLQRKGYFFGRITGYFGPVTEASVRNFQRSRGLKVDGIVGPATLRALKRELKRFDAPSPGPKKERDKTVPRKFKIGRPRRSSAKRYPCKVYVVKCCYYY